MFQFFRINNLPFKELCDITDKKLNFSSVEYLYNSSNCSSNIMPLTRG